MASIRDPAVAGMFYASAKKELEREVQHYLDVAPVIPLPGTIRGLVSPHAGYMYSGGTAAYGYKLLAGRSFEVVIVIGPSHREYFDGISIHPGKAFRTPLGDVPIDDNVRNALARSCRCLEVSSIGHNQEHSVEVQLPFLQQVLGSFSFVPVVVGDQRREYCFELAEAINHVSAGKEVLLVASSDLSHYYPYETAVEKDRVVVSDIAEFRSDELMEKLEQNDAEACGGGPIVSVMKASSALRASSSAILHYCNSGDVSPRRDAVVGYVSAAFVEVN